MNIYVIVEGNSTENKVYRNWIPAINPELKYVDSLDKIVNNNFSIFSGYGYPYIFKIIEKAFLDISNCNKNIDRVVICLDAELCSYNEKYNEVQSKISVYNKINSEIHIVIQFFCFETWALANRKMFTNCPQYHYAVELKKYINYFNVKVEDPELLPNYQPDQPDNLDRVAFAFQYLRKMIFEKTNCTCTYTKSNPGCVVETTYFENVKKRFDTTQHIQSFEKFLNAFK